MIGNPRVLDLSNYDFDSLTNTYKGVFQYNRGALNVTLCCEEGDTNETSQERLENTVGWLEKNSARLTMKVFEELGQIKNEQWLKEGEQPADIWTFRKKLIRHSFYVRTDNSMQVIILAGSLFWGHDIEVGITADYEYAFVTLVG